MNKVLSATTSYFVALIPAIPEVAKIEAVGVKHARE
jgi:hypothetical protein